ncbi:hypothetical protein BJV78DRAFT_1238769 [Lactifluus subvellereus]|nr:hypothetical protein BJV78DRAFT_1238769 [Lactifluus subvellereus]
MPYKSLIAIIVPGWTSCAYSWSSWRFQFSWTAKSSKMSSKKVGTPTLSWWFPEWVTADHPWYPDQTNSRSSNTPPHQLHHLCMSYETVSSLIDSELIPLNPTALVPVPHQPLDTLLRPSGRPGGVIEILLCGRRRPLTEA